MTVENPTRVSVHEAWVATDRDGGRRWWPVILTLVVILVVAAAVAGWMIGGRGDRSPAAAARADLDAARVALINAPGAHYTGRLTVPGGKKATIDLRVTNVGDASGTLEFAPGKPLSYLRIGGKTFVQGNTEAWIGYGFSADDAARSDGQQLLEPPAIGGLDVPATLTPSVLGRQLDPNAEARKAVTAGPSIAIDGRRSTPLISGAVTTYVSSGQVDRITERAFDIQVAPMTTDEVAGLYGDLRTAAAATENATDSETKITVAGSWSDPCGPDCTAIETLSSARQPFDAATVSAPPADDIPVWYQMVLNVNGIVMPTPLCTGVLPIPMNATATVSCPFTIEAEGGTVDAVLKNHPLMGRVRADALVTAVDGNATRSRAKTACPVERVEGSAFWTKPGC
ncbi:hypothetical protein ACWDUL_21735 [Nocardia niigatensis]|uniref:hypothetical protein n=1 Tax=Nocardia niigatensis TaxID=209249 RepID=UPI0005948FD9|nr:hypothetical protein [Nocardia niigatensis]